jgi:adenylosuccinate synthase
VGTTTGRDRRCGWFDCVLGRYAVRVNGLDCLAVTKLDVLDQFAEIKVCVAYKDALSGKTYKELPSIGSAFQHLEPIYESLPGWKESTRQCRNANDLPKRAKEYLDFLSKQLDVPIAVVSVGPERDDTIVIEDPIHGPKRVLVHTKA